MTVGAGDDLKSPHEIDVEPPSPSVYCRQAEALEQDGRYEEAVANYGHALVLDPGLVAASLAVARLYQWRLGSPRQARAICLEMLRKRVPSAALPIAYATLAQTLLEDVGLEDTRRELLETVTGDQQPAALRALMIALVREGRYDETRALGAELLESHPDDAELLVLLAQAITEQLHDVTLAESYYQRALRIDPLNQAVLNGWLLHLVRVGEPERGYELACNAMKAPLYANQRIGGTPCWDGSDPRGTSMIVDGTMGFGDCVQFARVATILHDAGATVTVMCRPPMHRLIQTARGVTGVTADRPQHDWFVSPFMGCSLINRSPAALGSLVPYLTPAAGAVERWKAMLPQTRALKVGLTWASNALVDCNNRHKFRSMAFSDMAPLLDVPGVDFYSLQCGAGPRRELEKADVRDLADGLTDFMETAAAMMALDLVISVDTAAAHVAGALGRPTFVLLPYTPSFRWPLHRRDYPWYPTMRTFTQSTPGVWSDPVRELRAELAEQARRSVAHGSQRPSR